MPTDLPNKMTNITFGGFLTGSGMSRAGPMQMVSSSAALSQSLSIAGTAGRYDDGVESFVSELKAAAATPSSREAHSAVWARFWGNADITITPSAAPQDPATAAQAARVTLLDKVNRAAFHSM